MDDKNVEQADDGGKPGVLDILRAWVAAIFGGHPDAPKGVWYVEWSEPTSALTRKYSPEKGLRHAGAQKTVFWLRSTAERRIAWGMANLPWSGSTTWRVRLCTEYERLSTEYES